MKNKESFVFYRSFYDAISDLKEKDKLKLFEAVCELALNEREIELKGIANTIFKLIKPQIIANNDRYINGKKGGRPKKEGTSGFENEETIGYLEKKANENVNENENENENENVNENENDNDNDNVNENDKLNEFNLYSNWDDNLQCEFITNSTKERCKRRSTYNINGKNYCNQHSKELIQQIENCEIKSKRNIFQKPTIEELKEYCDSSSLSVDCQYFFDYYESNGWLVGKNKMKDWKATLRNWDRKNKEKNNKTKVIREYTDEQGDQWQELSNGKRIYMGRKK